MEKHKLSADFKKPNSNQDSHSILTKKRKNKILVL